jgi:hypothetical protein
MHGFLFDLLPSRIWSRDKFLQRNEPSTIDGDTKEATAQG